VGDHLPRVENVVDRKRHASVLQQRHVLDQLGPLVEVGEHAQIEGRQVAEEQVGAARQPAAVDSRGALIATVHLSAEAGVEQAEIALDRVPRLRSAGSAAVEQVEQRSAGGNQHLVLELVAVVEVEEPPAAAVWAPATAGSHEAAASRSAGAA